MRSRWEGVGLLGLRVESRLGQGRGDRSLGLAEVPGVDLRGFLRGRFRRGGQRQCACEQAGEHYRGRPRACTQLAEATRGESGVKLVRAQFHDDTSQVKAGHRCVTRWWHRVNNLFLQYRLKRINILERFRGGRR